MTDRRNFTVAAPKSPPGATKLASGRSADAGGSSPEPVVRLVCSNRPRPSVQNNHSKGHQWWVRETHHASLDTGKPLYHGAKTLCGRDCADWLILDVGPMSDKRSMTVSEAAAYEPDDLCSRCAAKLVQALQ